MPGAWIRSSIAWLSTEHVGDADEGLDQDRALADVPTHRIAGLDPVDGVVESVLPDGDASTQEDETCHGPHLLDLLDHQVEALGPRIELPVARRSAGAHLGLVSTRRLPVEPGAGPVQRDRRDRAAVPIAHGLVIGPAVRAGLSCLRPCERRLEHESRWHGGRTRRHCPGTRCGGRGGAGTSAAGTGAAAGCRTIGVTAAAPPGPSQGRLPSGRPAPAQLSQAGLYES